MARKQGVAKRTSKASERAVEPTAEQLPEVAALPAVLRSPRARGRPKTVYPEGKTFESNGLWTYQWEWLKAYAQTHGLDGAQAQRRAVQAFIDAEEAKGMSSMATPKQDRAFEQLIQQSKKNGKKK